MFDPPLNEDAIWSLPLQHKMMLPSDAKMKPSRGTMDGSHDSINLNVDESTIPSDPIVHLWTSKIQHSYVGVPVEECKGINQKLILTFDPWWLILYLMVLTFLFLVKLSKRLKKIMMNNKGFFFFKFDSRAGLEAVLEGGPWLIQDGISLIATFIVSSEANLVDVVTIGIPSCIREDFTKETIRVVYEWRPPRYDVCKIFGHVHDQCPKKVVTPPIVSTSPIVTPIVEKTIDRFQMVGKKKKRKGKSKSNNGGQFAGPSVKQTVRYDPKATTNTPKEGEEDEEEEVENVYDETANLFTKIGGSSFTAAAG
ncbi:hypothetical protein Tco_1041816 [Tanacetum coccineum]|uniref:DUF4283 domain-containing protein n=1 Tax=Tanacetum coccineum TaxID=301880 RepID=A0ABQ5GH90_9ASTR